MWALVYLQKAGISNQFQILKGQTLLLLAAVTCLLKNVKHANKHDFGSVFVGCML